MSLSGDIIRTHNMNHEKTQRSERIHKKNDVQVWVGVWRCGGYILHSKTSKSALMWNTSPVN